MYTSDWVILIFTFGIGMVVGAFLYVSSFAPLFGISIDGLSRSEQEAATFSIIARQYGGMVAGYEHPSFRITGDGSYTYIRGGTNETAEGTIPKGLFDDVAHEAQRADLAALAVSTEKEMCNIFVDGFDYEYEITLKGARYTLDTCATALPYTHPLTHVLRDVWQYLSDGEVDARGPEGESGPLFQDDEQGIEGREAEPIRGIGGLLLRRMQEIF